MEILDDVTIYSNSNLFNKPFHVLKFQQTVTSFRHEISLAEV